MSLRRSTTFFLLTISSLGAGAGGPRWVAGFSYFDPAALGHPLAWRNGEIRYYTDAGALSSTVNQAQANAMIAEAAALWSAIPTAAISITFAGSLAEDVNGSNFFNSGSNLEMPGDVRSTALDTPLGVIYDADGSVLDALHGEGASDPNSCNVNGVTTVVDNFASDGTIAHALMVVNGRCAGDSAHVALLQYLLLRGFGRVLGLDWSQANDDLFPSQMTSDSLLGWPLMHPVEKLCNSNGNPCMPGTVAPRTDDIAAAGRLYPVSAANAGNFPGKLVTAVATVSIQGRVTFRNGMGMQGVNVVARPLITGTDQPDLRYSASAVSGQLFTGNAGNGITGFVDSTGLPFTRFGTVDASLQGWYDLSSMPLPPGVTQADYQLTFEAINPLYTGNQSVGPYALGQAAPSGTMPVVILRGLMAGAHVEQDERIADSAGDDNSGGDGAEAAPAEIPVTGEWLARVSAPGHGSWLRRHLRGGRQITLEAQPVNDRGLETEDKARVLAGVWNGDDPLGSLPDVGTAQPFNAVTSGLTTLSFQTGNDGDVRLELADQRGDGRPDYLYRGRLLYADTITPLRISLDGGPIVIDGVGFRSGNTVTVGGAAAAITSINSTEITAIAPAAPGRVGGNVDVTVTDNSTHGWTTIGGLSGSGLSYGAQGNDQIAIVAAPIHAVPIGVPSAFTVKASSPIGQAPAPGISVTYTVTQGAAALGCGQNSCTVITAGDGLASLAVTALNTSPAVVLAALSDGAGVVTGFSGAAPPAIAPISGTLYLAAGAVFNWEPSAVVLSNGVSYPGQKVTWSGGAGTSISSRTSSSGPDGVAWVEVTAGPLVGVGSTTVSACLEVTSTSCASFLIAGVDPSDAGLISESPAMQTLGPGVAVEPLSLKVVDRLGHPVAGEVINSYQRLDAWKPPCPLTGGCPTAPTLQTQNVQMVSSADGLVNLAPLTDGTVASHLFLLVTAGTGSTVTLTIERHP